MKKTSLAGKRSLCLIFVYLKLQGSSRQDLDNKHDCLETLSNQIAKVIDNCNILISGDLNSRISDRQECNTDIINDHNDVFNMLTTLMYNHIFNQLYFLNCNMSVKRVNIDSKTEKIEKQQFRFQSWFSEDFKLGCTAEITAAIRLSKKFKSN